MAHDTPGSPIESEAVLDAVLSRAPRPAMPAGLAGRIVAHATAQPQFTSAPDLHRPDGPQEPPASGQVIHLASAVKIDGTAPLRKRGLILGGGFAALAASLAAVMIIAQAGPETSAVPLAPRSAVIATGSEVHPVAPEAQKKAPERQLADAVPAAGIAKPAIQSAPETPKAASAPAQIVPPVPAQLATSGEPVPRDVAGPAIDPSSGPRVAPNRGLMGPPAPQQGWAFTGGAPAGGAPAGGAPGAQQSPPGGQSMPGPPPPPPHHGGHH